MRTGIAHLPLHTGKAPAWLFHRMKALSREIVRIIIDLHGPGEMLNRLSDPFWFQALGCALGFDWHSSGVTTTVCGAIKEGLRGIDRELGFFVAGGKGRASRKTPQEIEAVCEQTGLDGAVLVHASRMAAKVDSAAVQDGYQIYHHVFFFTGRGEWAVVQQGMNEESRYARRYHWLGEGVKDFVCEPHWAVCCDRRGEGLNLVAMESGEAREAMTDLCRESPETLLREGRRANELFLPREHPVPMERLRLERLGKVFTGLYEAAPDRFETLLGTPGVGPKSLQALSLLSELIFGVQASLKDPTRFSFAHGGKDGHPYPVDRRVYDRSTEILRVALEKARVGDREKMESLRRLSAFYPGREA
jgi:hypothetical protein